MRTSLRTAFTLIELLVVISIIAILANFALPAFSQVQERGQQTKALSNAKQVGLACKLFAQDYNGQFPRYTDPVNRTGDPQDSNAVLQTLIPDYLPDKGVFAIPKSAYCRNAGRAGGAAGANLLGSAENEWGYMQGLSDTSNSRFPLLADGCASNSNYYIDDDSQPGGVWRGRKAIVIRVDISGAVETTYRPGSQAGAGTQYTIKRDDNPQANALTADAGSVPPWLTGADVIWRNPTP